jgi:hypothetical protein
MMLNMNVVDFVDNLNMQEMNEEEKQQQSLLDRKEVVND